MFEGTVRRMREPMPETRLSAAMKIPRDWSRSERKEVRQSTTAATA